MRELGAGRTLQGGNLMPLLCGLAGGEVQLRGHCCAEKSRWCAGPSSRDSEPTAILRATPGGRRMTQSSPSVGEAQRSGSAASNRDPK